MTKLTKNESNRLHYEANRDRYVAQRRANRLANPEREVEATRAWRAANPDKVRAATRERMRRWREANPERNAEAERKRRQAHPEKNAEDLRKRRARKQGTRVFPIRAVDVAAKMTYWGNKCWMCEGPFEHVDHVKPLAKGGAHMLANLRPACASCNASKRERWDGVQALRAG